MIYKAKKSLGQNFLKSIPAINNIIRAGELTKNDIVLEIGPGKGVLTEKLLENAGKVIAIEKDNALFAFLGEKFEEFIQNGQLILENKDILEFNPNTYGLKSQSYKIIANIPYNITGAILKKFLTEEKQPILMVLMVQHEVAQRIIGKKNTRVTLANMENKESLLSISVKTYGEPKMVMKVPARYFSPAPKVDSAVILIKNISKNVLTNEKIDEEKFWTLVRAGFAHKRKILAGNLRDLSKKIDWVSELKTLNINEKTRAEDLSLSDWTKLVRNTQNLF